MDTPPAAPAPKKGMSGLAIAGIGCGGLLILTLIGGFILMGKACSKLGDIAGEIQKNPAKAAAMMALKFNPDVEIVSTNDAKNEITIRTKKDGKTMTMSFDDVAQGKLTMRDSDGKEVTIDGSQAAKDGKIVIKGPDGETVIGGATQSSSPAWVPVYPGMKAGAGGVKNDKDGQISGVTMGESTDAASKVKDFYEAKLKESGFKVETNTMAINGADTVSVAGTKDDGKAKVTVVINGEAGKTNVMIQYEGPK